MMNVGQTNREPPPEGKLQNEENRRMHIMEEHRSTIQRCQDMDSRQHHPSSGNDVRTDTQEEAPPRFSYTFPIFTGQRLFMYRRYNRKLVNLWASIPLALVMVIDFVLHYNLSRTSSSPLFGLSVALACVGYTAFAVNLAPYVLGYFPRYRAWANDLEKFVEQLPFYVGDVVNYTAVLSLGFNLVARVLAGTCSSNITLLETEQCNNFANSVPNEQIFVMYAAPLLSLTILRNVSLTSLALSWCSNVIFVAYCISYAQAGSQLWTLVFSLFFMGITLELERLMRVAFLHLLLVTIVKKIDKVSTVIPLPMGQLLSILALNFDSLTLALASNMKDAEQRITDMPGSVPAAGPVDGRIIRGDNFNNIL